MDEDFVDMLYNYIQDTWYESKCKDPKDIKRIIREELQKRPQYMDMKMSRLCLAIKRRCIAEL